MIKVPYSYFQLCKDSNKESYLVAKYGYYNEAQKDAISKIEMEAMAFTSSESIVDGVQTSDNFITGEPDKVVLDGSYYFLYDTTSAYQSQRIGYWSSEMSNENGLFETNPKLNIYLNKSFNTSSLIIYLKDICTELKVKYFTVMPGVDSNARKIVTISNNDSNVINVIQSADDNFNFACVQIEFIKTKEPYRYIKVNEIYFGLFGELKGLNITDYNVINETSYNSNNIFSNYMSITLNDRNGVYDIENPNNKIKDLKIAKKITLYHNLKVGNEYKEIPLGCSYIDKINHKNGKTTITGNDILYYYEDYYYGSRLYDGVGEFVASDVYKDFFDYYGITEYKLDPQLSNYEIQDNNLFGYVPPLECKEALRTILQATKCRLIIDNYGVINIKKISSNEQAIRLTNDIINNKETQSDEIVYNYNIKLYDYFTLDKNENVLLYVGRLEEGTHNIYFDTYPIKNESVYVESNTTCKIIKQTATYCKIELWDASDVKIYGKHVVATYENKFIENDKNSKYVKDIDNTLISKYTYDDKLEKFLTEPKPLTYDFETILLPFVELGDTLVYLTKYNEVKHITVEKIEYTNSILQRFKGV